MPATAARPGASLWRAPPRTLARLLAGLWIFGTGEALLVAAGLGNSPWTVFAEGVAEQTPLSVGAATVATSFAVLLLWVPLRVRPGLGTIANAVVIGVAIDAVLTVLGRPVGLPLRIVEVLGGVGLVGLGSGLYLGAALGPGPRDGLMTGLHRRTGLPLALVRGGIEVTALIVGAVLGGTVGLGTVAFAVLIGPAVAGALRVLGTRGAPAGRTRPNGVSRGRRSASRRG